MLKGHSRRVSYRAIVLEFMGGAGGSRTPRTMMGMGPRMREDKGGGMGITPIKGEGISRSETGYFIVMTEGKGGGGIGKWQGPCPCYRPLLLSNECGGLPGETRRTGGGRRRGCET